MASISSDNKFALSIEEANRLISWNFKTGRQLNKAEGSALTMPIVR